MCKNGLQTLVASKLVTYECIVNNQIPNCKKSASSIAIPAPVCDRCNPDFYMASLNTCTAVTTKIANCLSYETAIKCASCHGGYFLDTAGLTCTKTDTIPNCDIYGMLGTTCGICKSGFRPAEDSKTCVAETALIGCTNRTGSICEKCRYKEDFYYATDYSVAAG